jgi:putative GTP pyrophosphokinase
LSNEQFLSNIQKEKVKAEYDQLRPLYEKLADEVLFTVKEALKKQNILVHTIVSRDTKIKTFESFWNKIINDEIRKNPFEVIKDIAAIRVICLYRTDLGKVGNIIKGCFVTEEVDTSRTRTDRPFGYQSDHYTIKISKKCTGPRYDDIKKLSCEIQVRTILMDAWASVSHHLDYKQELDVPLEIRADFNALSGLFHIADTHFELFKKGIEEARKALILKANEGKLVLNQEVNLDTLTAYLQWKFPTRRQKTHPFILSKLITDLQNQDLKTLTSVDEIVNAAYSVILDFEKELHDKGFVKNTQLGAYGVIWASMDILIPDFFEARVNKSNEPLDERRKGMVLLMKKYREKLHQQ